MNNFVSLKDAEGCSFAVGRFWLAGSKSLAVVQLTAFPILTAKSLTPQQSYVAPFAVNRPAPHRLTSGVGLWIFS